MPTSPSSRSRSSGVIRTFLATLLVEHAAEVDRLSREFSDFYARDGRPWPDLAPHGD